MKRIHFGHLFHPAPAFLKPWFISALFSWLGWGFSPGRLFFTGRATGGIRIITGTNRWQNITGNRWLSRVSQPWRTPAPCRRFAPKNNLRPRPDTRAGAGRVLRGAARQIALVHTDSTGHQNQLEERFTAGECNLGTFGQTCVPSSDIGEDWPVKQAV